MLDAALPQESVVKLAFFGVLTYYYMFCLCQYREGLCVELLCHIFQKYLVLSGHANRFSDIYFCFEPLVPLQVEQRILYECVEAKFLVVHLCERVLVLHMPQDSLFNQPIQGQRVVGFANHVPFCVLLHFILQKLCALPKN